MSFSTSRHGHQRTRSRLTIGIPHYTNSVVEEKFHLGGSQTRPWFNPISIPLPGAHKRALRLWIPNYRRLPPSLARKRGVIALLAALAIVLYTIFAVTVRFGSAQKKWPASPWPTPSSRATVVYHDDDLRRIWQWEVMSGHYPSRRKLPEGLNITTPPMNPALPPRKTSRDDANGTTIGVGSKRIYLDLQSQPPDIAYPPRPVPGAIADLDVILEYCDFAANKYVRDCLDVLRTGGGLDNGNRIRRGNLDDWQYIYLEKEVPKLVLQDALQFKALPATGKWDKLSLPPLQKYRPYPLLDSPCDPENPKIFHIFWGGPITDKPYTILMSFLYTQNTGLHLKSYPDDAPCRPQFWVWINPAPAATEPPPNALRDMFVELKENPWAAPFLHPRFKDVIKFKLWNTTEMLDGIPELKDEWRSMESLFKSGAHVLHVSEPKQQKVTTEVVDADNATTTTTTAKALPTEGAYNRLSTVLSDMARFILCHRFGGIYLDADTVLLRDWEELFNWRGAFAYRWSWHEKYNTAVLHMSKGSALGTFLFRTALNNGLDFHPMTVSVYTEQAYMQGLLLRLPDALFDPAWLNTEDYQRERPPQPSFTNFADFFDTPVSQGAAPQALGFNGFFSGAYSYHYHSPWVKPFDVSRNYPDLGERFIKGEEALKAASGKTKAEQEEDARDQRDMDWSTVVKRTFEAYVRGERPNMYGEWIQW